MHAPAKASPGARLLAGARRLAGVLLVGGAVAVGLAVLLPALLGYQRYAIISGSMTGTYDRGSIVFDRVVPTSSLRTGDVITFKPPGYSELVTHRIHSLKVIRGQRVYTTKGDANPVADNWSPMTLREPQQAVVRFHVPYVGFVISALSDRGIRMVLIGVPALLIALAALSSLWTESGKTASVPRPENGNGGL